MGNPSIPLGWLYLPIAFALGALHALEPGHGKSLASAYLAGGKHTWKDAVILGVATTFSHTSVVILLAIASLSLEHYRSGSQIATYVSMVGATILIFLGAWVAIRSMMNLRHGHSHDHPHGHSHRHAANEAGHWGVIMIGLSNGVLPCPGALAALLVALALGQIYLGLVTVAVYSLGLAVALAAMGILVVEASQRMKAWLPSDRDMLWLPLASGVLVFSTGVWLIAFH